MRKLSEEFSYVKGEEAYLILWRETFKCLWAIERIESCFPNLELIIFENKRIVAYKHDCPVDLPCMKMEESEWEIYTKKSFSAAIWANNIMSLNRNLN
jgi:hypothetical protein